MTTSVNWPLVGGIALVCLSPLIWFAPAIWRRLASIVPHAAQTDKPAAKRSADAPAPVGAVDWVKDIVAAMGAAKAETILKALEDGATRDQARMIRISELEAGGKA